MEPIIKVENLKKHFPIRGGFLRLPIAQVKAVDDVSFSINAGETLGLVGESGCGKSTLGRCVLRLLEPTSGSIIYGGKDLRSLNPAKMMAERSNVQIIFQDPYASLNPRMTVYEILREPLNVHSIGPESERDKRIVELLEFVGLRQQVLNRYPHEFSGGQRQRIGIARALSVQPKFIVADEPVSALDVSVQAQVLNLIADIQKEFGVAFLFIAHDLAVVQHVSHRVGVMYLGKIVEIADTEELFNHPKHPYTQALLSAVPNIGAKAGNRQILSGEVPSPINPPSGCAFHPRCPFVMGRCRIEIPLLRKAKTGDKHQLACHLDV